MTTELIEKRIAEQQRIQAANRWGTAAWHEAHLQLSTLVSLLTDKPHDESTCVDCIDFKLTH